MTRPAFLFSLEACTGCSACQLACSIENELGFERSWRRVETRGRGHAEGGATFHLSLACHHCERPACMEHCPALAYRRDERTGAVLIDETRCIGCGYCAWACPYDAPQLDRARGVMTKCTFCNERLLEGLQPACVQGCPTGALKIGQAAIGEPSTLRSGMPGDANVQAPDARRAELEEDSNGAPVVTYVPPGFPRTPLGPSIRFVPPRTTLLSRILSDDAPRRPGKLALRHEWPLLVFTVLITGLVAWFAGDAPRTAWARGIFAVLAASALVVSTSHLGRPLRAWRAILNVRRSWLSREILLVSLFLGLAMAGPFLLQDLEPWTVSIGFLALFAVDRVYDVASNRRSFLHSADTLLAGAWLACVIAVQPFPALGFAAVIGFLYVQRHARVEGPWPLWAPLRLLSLVATSYLLTPWPGLAWFAVPGFVLDRCEFYDER